MTSALDRFCRLGPFKVIFIRDLASSLPRAWMAAYLVLGVLSAWDATGAETSQLLPHRATYRLSQHVLEKAGDVTAVGGRMEVNLEASCDGWRLEQFIGFTLHFAAGDGVEHIAHLNGWETASGRDFWFNTRTFENRKLLEELAGKAVSGEGSAVGEVQFSKPEDLRRELPSGTLFPTQHWRQIMHAAQAGERYSRATVFDGSTADSAYEITTFIGEASTLAVPSPKLKLLKDQKSWPLRLAYYRVATRNPSPEFEMSALLYDNGVVGNMIYDYGNFAMDVTLEEMEPLTKPDC